MSTNLKMKGLLKGLRYISEIFDNEKEPEMTIGLPTDVKHVAHIGWDGPSTTSPSWMNEFPSAETSSGAQNVNVEAKGTNPVPKSFAKDSLPWDVTEMQNSSGSFPLDSNSGKIRQSRRQTTANGSVRDSLAISKPKRVKNSSLESPINDSSNHRSRRTQNPNHGSESPSQDPNGIKKKSTRKKSKDSLGDGSTRASRSKAQDPLTTDPGDRCGYRSKNNETGLNSIQEVCEKGNECDEISRRIRGL